VARLGAEAADGLEQLGLLDTSVTEAQVKTQADYMATRLARFGWHYIVVDMQWYVPEASGVAHRDLPREQFARLQTWNERRGPGHWPDADILSLGVLDVGRRSSCFTSDEPRTPMTLWALARSPLMHGGD
jgi:hypothetical protein